MTLLVHGVTITLVNLCLGTGNWEWNANNIELGYLANPDKMGENRIYTSHNAYLYTNTQVSFNTYDSHGFHDSVHVI